MFRFLFLLIFLLAGVAHSNAQRDPKKQEKDSLFSVWKNESIADSTRLASIVVLIWEHYLFSAPDSAHHLATLEYELAKNSGIRKYEGDALNSMGISWAIRGELDRALEKFEEVLNVKMSLNDSTGIAGANVNIGNILRDQGDYAKAFGYYANGKRYYEHLNNWQGLANVTDNLGIVSSYSGNISKAVEYFEAAKKIREEKKDEKGLASSFSNLATAYSDMGKHDQTISYYLSAIALHTKKGNRMGLGTAKNNIAIQYKMLGEYEKAMQLYRESLAIRYKVNDKNGISSTLNNIGNLYRIMHENDSALWYFHQSLSYRIAINDKLSIAFAYNNIGSFHHDMGRYDSALYYNQKALELAKPVNAVSEIRRAHRYLYITHRMLQDMDKAEDHLVQLMELRQKDLELNFSVLSESDKENYFSTMQSDFSLYDDFMLSQYKNNPGLAKRSYNQALVLKGLILKSNVALKRDILNGKDSALTATYFTWISTKRKIASAYSKGKPVNDLELKAQQLETELLRKSAFFKKEQEDRKISWLDVQHKLKANEAALEFVRIEVYDLKTAEPEKENDVVYAALLLKKDLSSPVCIELCREQDLLSTLMSGMTNRAEDINRQYNGEIRNTMYNLIWKPLEPALKGIKSLHFSPAGLLHKIAFAAIKNNKGEYFSDHFQLNQMFSTGGLLNKKQKLNDTEKQIRLYGGIDYQYSADDPQVWNYLEGTLNEVEAIQTIANKKSFSTEMYKGKEAQEASIKSGVSQKGILHIATHGFFFPDPAVYTDTTATEKNPDIVFRAQDISGRNQFFLYSPEPMLRSGLVFSGANRVWRDLPLAETEDDGILTAQEIANLELRDLALVVLSACETGLGDIKGFEGVYGLQRAFKIAGAGSIIMSLWQVPDKETAEFMTLFYKNLVKNKDIRQSFAMAQKQMRKKYETFYWAAFVLAE